MTIDITNNSQYLTGRPRESVDLKAIIDAINELIQTELIDFAGATEVQASILTATYIWLDWIGAKLNFPRPTLVQDDFEVFGFDGHGVGFDQAPFWNGSEYGIGVSDETYRAFLIARGGQLLTDGTIASMTAVIVAAFGEGNYYVDNGDMSLDVIINPDIEDIVMELIETTDLLTKPAGVRFRLISRVVRGLLSIGTIGNIDLVQAHNLVVQEALSAGIIDSLALTQKHTIVVQETSSSSVLDNITLVLP